MPTTGTDRPRDDHDQPMPTVSDAGPAIQELVLGDLRARMAVGLERYGTLLRPHNGRDMLQDAYEEALDLCVYLRGCIAERDATPDPAPPPAPGDARPPTSDWARMGHLVEGQTYHRLHHGQWETWSYATRTWQRTPPQEVTRIQKQMQD